MDLRGPTAMLVEKAQAGDRVAFDELWARYASRLEASVRARLGQGLKERVEVGDILQETFLRAFQSVRRFRPQREGSFLAWLRRIAEHVILEEAAGQKKHAQVEADLDLPGRDPTPSQRARQEERFDRLQQALSSLSPDHRKVILLARVEKLPIKEIAVRMNRSADAVTNLLSRALAKLKDGFGDTESLHLPDRTLRQEPEDG